MSQEDLRPDRVVEAVRQRRPLVHCLTNAVTMNRVADALAAFGALPVMASAPEEAADMVEHADALVLNLGTPDAARWGAAESAAQRARGRDIPIVLDPVGCGATPWRTDRGRHLARVARPRVVRGNAPEIAALSGVLALRATLRGVTSNAQEDVSGEDMVAEAERIARASASAIGATVLVTGAIDMLCDGQRLIQHRSRAPILARVVGAGDVLTAVIGACLAVETDSLAAAWAGLTFFAAAARRAEAASAGHGSFWSVLLDELSNPLSTATFEREAHLAEVM